MKQYEVLTIEKLKFAMDKDSRGMERKNAEQLPKKQSKKIKLGAKLLVFLMYLLEPLLPSDGTKSDGRIASLVYLICLTTAGIVMNMTAWLQNDTSVVGITTEHIDGFLITCICPALLWIMYIFFKQNDRKTVDFIGSLPHSHRPLIAGAYVFGAGSSVMDALHISFYLQCSRNLSSLFFSVFKALFILAQILFLRKFANAALHKSQNIRLVLFHLLGTNVCLWFRSLFSHAQMIFKNSANTPKSWCSKQDVPMSKIWTASEPYLYPFTMEFSLIAGGMLFNLWSGMRDLDSDPQDIYIYDEIHDHDNEKEEKEKNFPDDSSGYIGSFANSPTLSRSQSHTSLYSRTSNHSVCRSCLEQEESHEIMDTYEPSADPGLLLGLLLSILLCISIAFLWVDPNSTHALKFYYYYQITLHTVMVFCLWLMLKGIQSQHSAWYPYNSDDTLLIVSFTGVFLYSGLSMTAAVMEINSFESIAICSLVKSSLVLLESMLQVTAIVKALRYRPSFRGTSVNVVRQVTLLLLTTNFALWGQDSFFELRNLDITPVQKEFYGTMAWRGVTVLSYPLYIFFRFHSGACLFEVWSTFKHY